jgi:hypothetical protein
MKLLFVAACSLMLFACSFGVQVAQKESFVPRTQPQTIFVVPFTTIMVPGEVSEGLFDLFIDNLNDLHAGGDLDFVILKQGLEAVDDEWLRTHDYIIGEVFAYVEDVGSSTASIRAKSRISLFQEGKTDPTLQLDYPVDLFYEKDYSTQKEARRKLAEKISGSMAQKLSEALAGS